MIDKNKLTKTISINEDTVYNNLNLIIDHPNKDAIVRLLHNLLAESHLGVDFFIKFILNEPYPDEPKVGDTGYFNLQNVWVYNKTQMLSHPDIAPQGYVYCTVVDKSGVHNYSSVKVEYTGLDDNGEKERVTTLISSKQFIYDEDL